MARTLSARDWIVEGIWTNWSRGPIFGSTLTVSPEHASRLSAALALIIGISGGQLWSLFQFTLHQYRATRAARSVLWHQSQTILRNTSTDLTTLWRLLRTALAWRDQRDIEIVSVLWPLILGASVHLALIILAGLYSSQMLETSNDVLTISPWCGTFDVTYYNRVHAGNVSDFDSMRLTMEYNNYYNARYAAIQQLVDLCERVAQGCEQLPTSALPWSSEFLPGYCPFSDDLCHPDVDGTMKLDTGLLSSHEHFGFNAPRHDRISFRLKAQCIPLDDSKHVTGWTDIPASENLPAHQASDAFWGPTKTSLRNATFSVTKQNVECEERQITPPYSLDAEITNPGGSVAKGGATFDPILGLQLQDADVHVIMLSSHVAYEAPVTDPWFSASQSVNEANAQCLKQNRTQYVRDRPLTTMACTQQLQICNTTETRSLRDEQCTPLLARVQLRQRLSAGQLNIELTPYQQAAVERLLRVAADSSFFALVSALTQATTAPLRARLKVAKTLGPALPADQWQDETKYWMELILGHMQQLSLDYGTGQFAASRDYINVTTPSDNATKQAAFRLCQNQMVRSTTYRNYNFFALVLTVTFCTTIIILGLCLEDIVAVVRRYRLSYTGGNGKQDMWNVNSDLWMLRIILELKRRIPWTISRNGQLVTHGSYEASLDDLIADRYEVVDGRIMPMPVTTHQESRSRRHCRHGAHLRCGTCGLFEMSRVSSAANVHADAAGEARADDLDLDLSFQNNFTLDAQLDSPALMQTTAHENGNLRIPPARLNNSHSSVGLAVTTMDDRGLPLYERSGPSNENVPTRYTSLANSDADLTYSMQPLVHARAPSAEHMSLHDERTGAVPRGRHEHNPDLPIYRPPSDWGVLSQRLSGLWWMSWQENRRNSASHVRLD